MAMGERIGALLRDPMIVFQRLKQMWVASSHTDSFRHVFTRELLHLCRRHAIRRLEIRPDVFRPTRAIMREGSFCDEPVDAPAEMKPATLEERRSNLSGLALSGGGIRSASFACGLLEALAETKYLESFDYLSTVSGGGYAGTALTWSLHQQPHNAIGANDFATMTVDDVQNPRDLRKGMKITQIPLLKHIRRRANYLAPNDSISLMVGLLNTIRMSAMSVLIYAILIVAISIPLVWLYDRAAAGACDASGDPFSVLRNNKNYLLTVIAGWPWQARIAWLLNGFLDLSELAANTFAPASYSEETWPRQCLARFSTLIASALIAIYIIYFLSLLLLYAFIHSFELSYKNRVSALLNFTMITTVIFGMLVLSLIPIILGYSDNIFTNDSLQIGSLSALIGSAVSFGLSMVQRFGERVRVLLIRLAALLISVLALTLVLFVSFSITRNIPGTFFAERFGPHVIWNSAIAAGTGLAVAVLVYGLITKAPMSQQWRSRGLFLFAVASAISMGGFIFLCVALINAHIPNEVMLVFIRLDGVMFGVVVLFNFLNPNSISSHRFYRDRLMETFMPSQSGRNYKPADNAELYRMFDAHLSFEDG
ncbi:MAG: patatin-like phospholipase family protein, partial [Ferrovibrio sp.]